MEDLWSLLLLAIIQGFTEWIPISSSSQLAIVANLINYDMSVYTSVALHFGTLLAVFAYFGKDIIDIVRDLLNGNWKTDEAKLGFALIIAAIPAGIVGFLLKDFIAFTSESFIFMASGLIITSMLLFVGSLSINKNKKINYGIALLIGLAQIAALFRGISRSGSTIVSGLLLGLNEKTAVKFSFLLSIPIIFGANILSLGNQTLPGEYAIASLISFVVGISTIHLSFNYLLADRKNLKWFGLFILIEAIVIFLFYL